MVSASTGRRCLPLRRAKHAPFSTISQPRLSPSRPPCESLTSHYRHSTSKQFHRVTLRYGSEFLRGEGIVSDPQNHVFMGRYGGDCECRPNSRVNRSHHSRRLTDAARPQAARADSRPPLAARGTPCFSGLHRAQDDTDRKLLRERDAAPGAGDRARAAVTVDRSCFHLPFTARSINISPTRRSYSPTLSAGRNVAQHGGSASHSSGRAALLPLPSTGCPTHLNAVETSAAIESAAEKALSAITLYQPGALRKRTSVAALLVAGITDAIVFR